VSILLLAKVHDDLTVWLVRFKVICDNGNVVLIDAEPVWCSYNSYLGPQLTKVHSQVRADRRAVAIDVDEHSQSASHPLKNHSDRIPRFYSAFQFDFTDLSDSLRKESKPCQCWSCSNYSWRIYNFHRYTLLNDFRLYQRGITDHLSRSSECVQKHCCKNLNHRYYCFPKAVCVQIDQNRRESPCIAWPSIR